MVSKISKCRRACSLGKLVSGLAGLSKCQSIRGHGCHCSAWVPPPQRLIVEPIKAFRALQSLRKPRWHQCPRMSDFGCPSICPSPLTIHICLQARARNTLRTMQSQESVQRSSNSVNSENDMKQTPPAFYKN